MVSLSPSGSADEKNSGWSIWLFIAIFVVLSAMGLAAVVLVGNPSNDSRSTRTRIVPTGDSSSDPADGSNPITSNSAQSKPAQSKPASTDSASSDPARSDSTRSDPSSPGAPPSELPGSGKPTPTPATLPGGGPAPEDVTRVVATDEAVTLGFKVDPAGLGAAPLAVVPPLSASASGDGSALVVSVGCARTTGEQLAQLSVSETDSIVTVSAVTLVPPDVVGCKPNQRRVVTVPLKSPLGNRSVMVVPGSTKLPSVDLGAATGG